MVSLLLKKYERHWAMVLLASMIFKFFNEKDRKKMMFFPDEYKAPISIFELVAATDRLGPGVSTRLL
jgi:hypothetical protein